MVVWTQQVLKLSASVNPRADAIFVAQSQEQYFVVTTPQLHHCNIKHILCGLLAHFLCKVLFIVQRTDCLFLTWFLGLLMSVHLEQWFLTFFTQFPILQLLIWIFPPPCNEFWHFVINTIAKCYNSTQHSRSP